MLAVFLKKKTGADLSCQWHATQQVCKESKVIWANAFDSGPVSAENGLFLLKEKAPNFKKKSYKSVSALRKKHLTCIDKSSFEQEQITNEPVYFAKPGNVLTQIQLSQRFLSFFQENVSLKNKFSSLVTQFLKDPVNPSHLEALRNWFVFHQDDLKRERVKGGYHLFALFVRFDTGSKTSKYKWAKGAPDNLFNTLHYWTLYNRTVVEDVEEEEEKEDQFKELVQVEEKAPWVSTPTGNRNY